MNKKSNRSVSFTYNEENEGINVRMWNCENCASLSKETIEGYIREGVNYMFNHPNEHSWYTQCGDTLVHITREDDDALNISVATPRSFGYVKQA